MSILFWGAAAAMLFIAVGFVAVPLKTGRSLLATPGAVFVVFLPLAAVALYALLGSPGEPAATHAAGGAAPARDSGSGGERPLASVASMVDGLRARLEGEPDDADGWILLARSYEFMDRPDDALAAYKHAQALGKTDINLETSLLGSSLSGQVSTTTAGPTLRGRIELSTDAAAIARPGDTLFVFAKESREQRMPVVALRKTVADLPMEFELTDKEIMVPGQHLGDFDQLIVTARISRSGNASDNDLQLEAWSEPVSPASPARIELLIGSANE